MLGSSPLVSYYLWNEAITLLARKNGLDLLFSFSGVLLDFFFFKPSYLTQIISMVIITGLLLTIKKHDF
jgi:hypothetical protein